MKKIFKHLMAFSICMFAFIYGTKAATYDEALETISSETIKVDMTDSNRSFMTYTIHDEISQKFVNLVGSYADGINVLSCTDQSCETEFFFEDRHDVISVPISMYGLYLENEYFTVSVGQEITLKYKYIDKNGNAKDITLGGVVSHGNNDSLEINGNKVKPLKKGIYNVDMWFEEGENNKWLSAYILCQPQDVINEKLKNLTKFTSDISYRYYEDTIPAAEYNLIDYVFPEAPSYDIFASGSKCATEDCSGNVYDFFFEITMAGNQYTFSKQGVEVTEVGFMFNEDNSRIDLGAGESHQTKFTLYAGTATWASLDPSIATVDQGGKITAVKDGATVITVDYGGEYKKSLAVTVKSSQDTIKKHLQTIANNILTKSPKISVKAVSTLDREFLYSVLYEQIYDLLEEYEDVDNIDFETELSDDNKTVTVTFGYSYYFEYDNQFDWVTYCKTNPDAEGYDCDVTINLQLEYVDDQDGFDDTLVTKAKALLDALDVSKPAKSYLNYSVDSYLSYKDGDEDDKWAVYFEKFIEVANLDSLIPNDDGLRLELDQRWGGYGYGPYLMSGFATIYKDNALLAGSEKIITVKQVLKVAEPTSNTESAILDSIKASVKAALSDKNATITVSKVKNEDGLYAVKVNSNGKEIELDTYIEYSDDIPAVGGDVQDKEITSIKLAGIVIPVEGESTSAAGVTTTTEGLSVRNAKWYEDTPTWMEDGPATIFVAGKRYILVVEFNVADGYVIVDNFDEDQISANVTLMRKEYVPTPDVRLYFEARAKEVPAITNATTVKVTEGVDNTLDLSWIGMANVDGYKVLRSTSKTGKYTEVADVIGNMYTDTGLTYGKTYYYKVTAYNEKSSKTSSVVSGKTVPNKVTGLKIASANSTSIKTEWEKVNVTGYEVYYGTSTKKMKKATTISKNGTLTYNKTKLKANTTYYFKVRAYKTVSGKKIYGPYSDVVSTKTAPSTPSITLSNKDYKTLNVKLNSVKGATNYILEKSTDKKVYEVVQELPASGTLAVTDLTAGTTYHFRLKVCNSVGNCSAYSKVMSKKVVPATPSMSVSSPITKQVLVKVNAQEGAVGYEIYRSNKKNKGFKLISTLTNEDEVLEYLDSTAKKKTYYYKVRTYVLNGETKVYSSYSGVKKIKSK